MAATESPSWIEVTGLHGNDQPNPVRFTGLAVTHLGMPRWTRTASSTARMSGLDSAPSRLLKRALSAAMVWSAMALPGLAWPAVDVYQGFPRVVTADVAGQGDHHDPRKVPVCLVVVTGYAEGN